MYSNTARAFLAWALLLGGVAACAATNTDDRRNGTLQSDQGSRANRNVTGELQPPPTGDEEAVKQPPPEASQQPMRVIPPPGTPGGDPNIIPK